MGCDILKTKKVIWRIHESTKTSTVIEEERKPSRKWYKLTKVDAEEDDQEVTVRHRRWCFSLACSLSVIFARYQMTT